MNNKIQKAATIACLGFTAALVILVGSRGLGSRYPQEAEFWVLQALHLSFLVAFGLGLVQSVRAGRKAETAALGIPLAAFFVSLALAAFSLRIPAPLLIVFDLYVIVICSLRMASAAPALSVPRAADYAETPISEAYAYLNTGGIVIVCTKASDGSYDLAPIAWSCPLDYEPSSRVMIVLDPGHRTSENIEASKEFVLALPTFAQKGLVEKTGAISGRDADKYSKFGILSMAASSIDARVPEGVAGYLECRLLDVRRIGSVAVYSAEVARAAAVPDAWRYRLHYIGGNRYYRPARLFS